MIDLSKMREALGRRHVSLPSDVRKALEAWQGLQPVAEDVSHFFVRHVAVGIATTGLRPDVDRLLGVAAIGIHHGALGGDDILAFDLPAEQGRDATARQWCALLRFLGKSPVVTFRAAYVDAFLRHVLSEHLGLDFAPQWVDLAWVLPELFGETKSGGSTLDDWLAEFNIERPAGREAMPGAIAIAKLLLAAQAEAMHRGVDTPKKLREIERDRRWLGR